MEMIIDSNEFKRKFNDNTYYAEDSNKREIRMLNKRVDELEKELQTLKDNLYEVFFKDNLTEQK